MTLVSSSTEKLLAISNLKGIGGKKLQALSSIPDFEHHDLSTIIRDFLPKSVTYTNSEIEDCCDFAKRQIELAHHNNHCIISFFDESFPNSLKRMHDRPNILFVAGDASQLQSKNITVIGTREPSEHGEEIAKRITKWFAEREWNIVSGLAYGVDKLAHEQSINSSAKTIAVLAQGLEKVYPAKHKYLTDKIVETGGALVSEYAYNSFSGRANFVQRDRIQAGLSSGVILIQSGLNGGSLHASRKAIEYERALIVAGQSYRDINASIDKIQANMVLLEGNQKEVLNILKKNSFDESLLIKLKDASYLLSCEEFLLNIHNTIERKYIIQNSLDI
jgi:DNA processing protein